MWAALRATIETFRSEKLRFFLTVSGIIVGVGSLVIMASFLEVGQNILQETSAQATGDDVITVSNDWRQMNEHPDVRRLDQRDQDALAASTLLSEGTRVTATYGMTNRKAVYKTKEYEPFTIGVGAEAFEVYKLRIARGRLFSAEDYAGSPRVVIVGALALDGKVEVGDPLRVQGRPYTVIGVLEEKADMGPGGPWSWNQRLMFPERTYRLDFDATRRPTNIVVKVALPVGFDGVVKDFMLASQTIVDNVLMRNRTVKTYELEGVSSDDSTEMLILDTIRALLYLTTIFSMVVGGINIMNIMLVTVVERTREIGLRRALGATRGLILQQFLAETLMITLVGAVIGVVGALGVLAVGSWALTEWVTEWPFWVEPWSVVTGVLFSSVIGLGFGVYPAWRASRLDPVEALRSD